MSAACTAIHNSASHTMPIYFSAVKPYCQVPGRQGKKLTKISFLLNLLGQAKVLEPGVQSPWSTLSSKQISWKFWGFRGRVCYRRKHAPASHTEKDSPRKSPVASMGKWARWPMCLLHNLCGHFFHSGLPSASNSTRDMVLDKLDKYTLYTLMFSHGTDTVLQRKVHCGQMTYRRYARSGRRQNSVHMEKLSSFTFL